MAMIDKQTFEQHLSHIKCNVKSCNNQAMYIEPISNLNMPLTKKLDIDGYIILCDEHYKMLYKDEKSTIISFLNKKGELVCNRCGKSWMNIFPDHKLFVRCKFCKNGGWRSPRMRKEGFNR